MLNACLHKASTSDNFKLWIAAIKDIFDGDNGDNKFSSELKYISAIELKPTQSEIDIENSAKWTQSKFVDGVANIFTGKIEVKDFLKLVQGVIVDCMINGGGSSDGDKSKLPVGKARPENNIFGDKLSKEGALADKIKEMIEDNGTEEKLVKALKEQKVEVSNAEDIGKLAEKNVMV